MRNIFSLKIWAVFVLLAPFLATASAETKADEARVRRTENVSIQILSSANGQGEIGECE